jgi:hypothetical protein
MARQQNGQTAPGENPDPHDASKMRPGISEPERAPLMQAPTADPDQGPMDAQMRVRDEQGREMRENDPHFGEGLEMRQEQPLASTAEEIREQADLDPPKKDTSRRLKTLTVRASQSTVGPDGPTCALWDEHPEYDTPDHQVFITVDSGDVKVPETPGVLAALAEGKLERA